MVRIRVVLGGFYYGSGNDYKYGLKIYLSGELNNIYLWEFSAGEEYIMRVGGYKSMVLFNLLAKLDCTDK